MKRAFLLFVVLAAALSCAANHPSPGAVAIAAAEAAHRADPRNTDLTANLMTLYFNNNLSESCIALYEENQAALETRPDMLGTYGAALCQKGGAQKDVTEILYWVRKGMLVLDDAVARFPESWIPYLYRGITYSHFPAVMNARSVSEADFQLLLAGRDSGRWRLADWEIVMIYQAYLAIGTTFGDGAFLREKRVSLQAEHLASPQDLYAAYDSAIAGIAAGRNP